MSVDNRSIGAPTLISPSGAFGCFDGVLLLEHSTHF